jgi:hypothetical protein
VDHKNKEGSNCPKYAAELICVQSTVVCYRGACKACRQTVTVQFNSATHAQLTISGYGYSGDTIRQDGTTGRPGSVQQSDKIRRLHAADAVQDIICYFYPLEP